MEMRPVGKGKQLEQRRQRAIGLLNEGHAPVEVARLVGVDRRSVRRWNAAYRKQGAKGLAARPAPGRPSKLTARQRQRMERVLLRGAAASGFESDLWTCPRVALVIKGQFGISYHVDHIGRLLRSLGWTPQRPTRRALERDEERIQRWIKQDWPRIKKKPGS
jgi:transposase